MRASSLLTKETDMTHAELASQSLSDRMLALARNGFWSSTLGRYLSMLLLFNPLIVAVVTIAINRGENVAANYLLSLAIATFVSSWCFGGWSDCAVSRFDGFRDSGASRRPTDRWFTCWFPRCFPSPG